MRYSRYILNNIFTSQHGKHTCYSQHCTHYTLVQMKSHERVEQWKISVPLLLLKLKTKLKYITYMNY